MIAPLFILDFILLNRCLALPFTVGMLVAFQMFSGRLSGPVLRLVGLWQEFQQADIAVKRLGDVMDAPTEPMSLIPARAATPHTRIEVDSISFRYSDSGKSTLAKLLLAFHHPQQGSIKFDGRDIRHLAANELRAHFGVVPQETTLFSGTIL